MIESAVIGLDPALDLFSKKMDHQVSAWSLCSDSAKRRSERAGLVPPI
jgi:hypothetical protein